MRPLRHWLTPPVFEDENKTHQAFMLHIIVWALICVPIPYVLYTVIQTPDNAGRAIAQAAFGEAVNVCLLYLLRRGQVRLASIIQVISFWGFFTATAVTGAGVHGPAYLLGYGLVIVIAGVLLGGRGALVVTLAVMVTGGLLVYAESQGRFVPDVSDTALTTWIVSLVLFPVSATLQNLAARTVRQALARARVSEARTRALLEAIPDMIFEFARDGTFLYFVPAPEVPPYVLPEQFLGKKIGAVMPPHVATLALEAISRVLDTGQVQQIEYQLPEGEHLRYYEARLVPSGSDRVMSIVRDITGRKHTESALRDSEEKFRTFIEQASDGVALVDEQGLIQEWNQAQERVAGLKRAEVIGMPFWDVQLRMMLPERRSAEHREALKTTLLDWLRTGQLPSSQQPIEVAIVTPTGQTRFIQQTAFLIRTGSGNRVGSMARDITERKWAEKQVQQRLDELATVNAVSQVAASQLELGAMLELTGEKLRQILNVHGVYIALVDPQSNLVSFPYWRVRDGKIESPPIPLGPGLASWVIRTRGPLVINRDYERRSAELGAIRRRRAQDAQVYPRAWLGVPMQVGNQVIGIISAQNYDQEDAFADDDVRLWSTIAANVGIAIQNAQLFTSARQELAERKLAEKQTQQRLHELAVIHAVSQAAATQLELDALFELIAQELFQLFDIQEIFFALHDRQTDLVQFPYYRHGDQRLATAPVPLGQGLSSRVILSRQPLLINQDYERRSAELGVVRFSPAPASLSQVSWLGVPIQAGEQVIGVICVMNLECENAFTEADVRLLTTIAMNVGIAVQNAQLYTSAQQELAERKQIQQEREKLIAELETKNAELERFTYTVSHDLKSPLVTIRGFLGFVEQAARAGNLERVKADMARITDATDKMQRLLNELLELSRIGRMMNPPKAVSFEAIAREAIELVQGHLEARGVRVEIAPDLPMVYGDRARLVEVVQNLVDNGCKFMGNQAEPRIEIGARSARGVDADPQGAAPGKPILFVRDNGIGIEPQYHERIFGLFNKLDVQSEGTGVGLALVKRIVEVHGGRIWVESELGQGATFLFTLASK